MTKIKTAFPAHQPEVTRLFSHLQVTGDKFTHQPGSVLGSTALVAGTTVGAGILALPAVTLPSGVIPSTVLLIVVWLYVLVSGLLIAEASMNTMRLEGRASVGLLAMIENTLGFIGGRIAGAAYLFLQYSLLVAYVTQGGEILISAVFHLWGIENRLPAWVGTTAFTLIFGSIMYLGREKFIEKLNNFFVGIVIASFLGLLLLGTSQIEGVNFWVQNWSAVVTALPIMLVALFYHNIVTVVVTQLEGDSPKIRQSIVIGSMIPLVMFLAWNAVILGSVSPDMINAGDRTGFDPLQVLRTGGGGEWLGVLVSIFSEFAIVTSFIGCVYGLINFLKDISPTAQDEPGRRLPLFSLVLLPPISLGAINPSIFFTALDLAGTFSISILVGIIPALATWKQRQQLQQPNQLVPGGKLTLIVMIAVASGIILKQLFALWIQHA